MIKQVLVIRKDLKMRRGKEISQGAHGSIAFITNPMRDGEQRIIDGKCYLCIPHPSDAEMEWINGIFTKICLVANSATELADLYAEAIEAGLVAHIIEDQGKTEFHDIPTMTCLAIGPDEAEKIDAITGHLKLY